MITLDMVKRGYEAGIINLIDSPHDDGVVCKIGDNWFYFGGETAAEMTAKDYRRDIPLEDIVRSVFQVLEDFRKDGDVFEDEYLYYEAYLGEQLRDLSSPLTAKKGADFVRGGLVKLSLNDGTMLAESMLVSSLRNLETAREVVSEVNEGTYQHGQAPLRFDCETSPALADDMRDLVDVLGKLVETVGMDMQSLAEQIFKTNYPLAHALSGLVEKEVYKEDISKKMEDMGYDVDGVTDAVLEKMAERFDGILSKNDGYRDYYWASAETAIDEVLKEKAQGEEENALAWKTSDEMVDLALKDFKGFHDGQSSGLYGLGDFIVDGERMELVVEIYQYMDESEHRPYYGVYYWVGYYGDDTLFADWEYTSSLDVGELKQLVSDLEGRDFTEDIRKCMGKGSVEAMIGNAKGRCIDAGANENIERENVKE